MHYLGIQENLNLIDTDLERRITRLSALYEISSTLNYSIDIDQLLKLILQKTKELLNVEGASIIFWDEKKKSLYFPIVAEETQELESRLRNLFFSCDLGIAGWVLRECKPALVNEVDKDPRFYREVDERTGYKTKSLLCVPLCVKRGILGVIETINKKDGPFTENDKNLLMSMAGNIAISIENATLYHDLKKAEAFLRRQNAELKQYIKEKYNFDTIIGNSKKILDVIKKAEQVSLTDSTVLIFGETGTGKELIAQAIHNNSPRSSRNFVAINCGAIPENLLESELFGHEKGAFTTATSRRIGRFEEADGGTLLLDEIGDMPLNLQVKLLRVLEEGVIQRLGSNQEIPVDVRIIAATHQDLNELVKCTKFRQDLFFRLKVFEIEIPPLRERRGDIPVLIDHFIKSNIKRLGKQVLGVDDTVHNILYNYDYPGNVRELKHIIERAIILTKGGIIGSDVLPKEICRSKSSVDISADCGESFIVPRNNNELKATKTAERKKAEERVERAFLMELMASTRGNVSKAALQAKINRSWLAQLISKHKLDLVQFRKNP
ncbi:MAG: sigma 54-interacting transcriptional regulator [bacterium]